MKKPRARRQEIASAQHPLLKRLRAALRGGELTPDGLCALEGPHLLEEALKSGLEISAVVASRSAVARLGQVEASTNGRLSSYLVNDRVFRSLSQTENPQGIAALARLPAHDLKAELKHTEALVAVVVGVQDPGNLGTILRSLEAFGGTACLLGPGTVSPYNSKAVRAAAGALFRIPIFPGLSLDKILSLCENHGLQAVGLAPHATRPLSQLDLKPSTALFVGSEASGLPEQLLERLTAARIPLAQSVESLNAAMAASLAFYEAARQRGLTE